MNVFVCVCAHVNACLLVLCMCACVCPVHPPPSKTYRPPLALLYNKQDIARAWKEAQAPSLEAWREGLDRCFTRNVLFTSPGDALINIIHFWECWAGFGGIRLEPCPHLEKSLEPKSGSLYPRCRSEWGVVG